MRLTHYSEPHITLPKLISIKAVKKHYVNKRLINDHPIVTPPTKKKKIKKILLIKRTFRTSSL